MTNPFLYGSPVSGSCFIDRQKELTQITNDLARGQNLILFSPRRYGKTSVLKEVLNRLQNKGQQVFYIDLYRITTVHSFCDHYMTHVISRIEEPAQKLYRWVSKTLSMFRPKLVFEQPDLPKFEIDLGTKGKKPQTAVHQLLEALQSYMGKKGKKACVAFDEFQEILNMEGGQSLEKEMRSAFQHHKNISYAFCGSQHHMMLTLFRDKTRPFYNFGAHYQLEAITHQDWEPFLLRKFHKAEIPVDKTIIEELLDITKGHPYYTQMLASELWQLFEGMVPLPQDCVRQALLSALRREQHAFHELWDSLTVRQRIVLELVAREQPCEVYSGDFIRKLDFPTPSSAQRAVRYLLDHGYLVRKNKLMYVSDPILAIWLKNVQFEL